MIDTAFKKQLRILRRSGSREVVRDSLHGVYRGVSWAKHGDSVIGVTTSGRETFEQAAAALLELLKRGDAK